MDLFKALEERRKTLRVRDSARPLLLLDIDDTLIDCRYRKRRVFLDFAAQEEIRREFPSESQTLATIPLAMVQYRVFDSLKLLGIDQRDFGDRLFQFWLNNYFTYPYLVLDEAFPGAVRFVRESYANGFALVYLTGRDQPGMGPGTFEAMHKLGFPRHGEHIHFLLKPDPKTPDLAFKMSALEEVAQMGPVAAAFENELSNLNAMAERFPEAAMYWRNTLFSPDPPEPHPRVEVLAHFP